MNKGKQKASKKRRLSITILRTRLTFPYQLYPQCTAIQSDADPHPNFHLGWELQGARFTPTEPRCVFVHHGADDNNRHIKRRTAATASFFWLQEKFPGNNVEVRSALQFGVHRVSRGRRFWLRHINRPSLYRLC